MPLPTSKQIPYRASEAAGLIFAGRLPPLKARLLQDVLLRAGIDRDSIAAVLSASG